MSKSYINILSDTEYGVIASYYEDVDINTFRKIRELLKNYEVRRR